MAQISTQTSFGHYCNIFVCSQYSLSLQRLSATGTYREYDLGPLGILEKWYFSHLGAVVWHTMVAINQSWNTVGILHCYCCQKSWGVRNRTAVTYFTTSEIMQMTSAISNSRYLKLSLYRTFSLILSALSVTASVNSFGMLNPVISNFHYVRTIFSAPSILRAVFHPLSRAILFHSLKCWKRHSKIWSNVCFLFQHSNMLVKQKLKIKSLGEKCLTLKDLQSGLSIKEVSKSSRCT